MSLITSMQSASHPVWGMGRLCVLLGALPVILYMNASSFDKNEIMTIIVVMTGAVSVEGVSGVFGKAPNHPVWGFSRLVFVMITLIYTLYMTASHFDKTELNTIIALFLVAAGVEGTSGLINKQPKQQ